MPCESCRVQFTVFRRKRSCADCKRFYCSNCLSAYKRPTNDSKKFSISVWLCDRCKVFAKRPLLRAELLQLRPKDLIFYLQSKHIPTTGCVEKEELVALVLNHAQHSEETTSNCNTSQPNDDFPTNPFDNLKQTCQSFFSNITDNLSDSFSSFDNKTTSKIFQQRNTDRGTADSGSSHIFDQPRVSTREIPTYSSSQYLSSPIQPVPNEEYRQRSATDNTTFPQTNCDQEEAPEPSVSCPFKINNSNECSVDNIVHSRRDGRETEDYNTYNDNGLNSTCECSEDELMVTLSDTNCSEKIKKKAFKPQDAEISVSSPGSFTKCNACVGASGEYKIDTHGGEISSQSSFEELGAIGGISDDSKTATDTNSSNIEHWQILDSTLQPSDNCSIEMSVSRKCKNNAQIYSQSQCELQPLTSVAPQRTKKVSRRRSDSYLNRHRAVSDDDSPIHNGRNAKDIEPNVIPTNKSICCQRCGKHKSNLRQQVEKMRRHLESSKMSESDIKLELQEFLQYLEKQSKSIEMSDTETATSSLSAPNCTQITPVRISPSTPAQPTRPWHQWPDSRDHEGMHVHAAVADSDGEAKKSRFINLEDFDSLKDLECLSVKQLKEVLMLNRVDYKGCCEKQELLDRVQRLWKNLKSMPAVDRLHTDELCKICMDAPIECVILECGHMATCTNCGKVLSECPICRQYIVRVVRFFRA